MLDDFNVYKIRIIDFEVDEFNGVVRITYHRYIDRFEMSPMIENKLHTFDKFNSMFYHTKEEAIVVLTKLLLNVQLDDTGYSNYHDRTFDKSIIKTIIKHTIDDSPEKFI